MKKKSNLLTGNLLAGKTLLTLTLGVLSLTSFVACKPKLTKEQEVESNRLMQEIESELQLAEISKPLTKEEHPELYEQWGKDWVEIINTMRPLAVERVRLQPECQKQVAKVELADNSEIKKTPILNVSCKNGEVFVVTLGDITQEKRLYPVSKLFGKNAGDFVKLCLDDIKPHLMHPDSIVQDSINTTFDMDNSTQTLTIQIPITVETGYNTRIGHVVKCRSDSQMKVVTELEMAKAE